MGNLGIRVDKIGLVLVTVLCLESDWKGNVGLERVRLSLLDDLIHLLFFFSS